MKTRHFYLGLIFLGFLLVCGSASALEEMSDDELRQVTGYSGFIESEEDLRTFESARHDFEQIIRRHSLGAFLSDEARQNLLGGTDLEPERQAELLHQTTRDLLTNRKFLKRVERTGRALVRLSKALRQLQSLR